MKKLCIVTGLIALLVFGWRWSAATSQDLDPLKVAPETHKLLFENRFVRVLDVHVPPGQTEPWHSHGRRVAIYLTDFHSRTTERGGQPQENLRKSGFARWVEPTTHQVENIGKNEAHVISVELR